MFVQYLAEFDSFPSLNFSEGAAPSSWFDVESANPPAKNHVGDVLGLAVRAQPIASKCR
jgi:hypothetical protein